MTHPIIMAGMAVAEPLRHGNVTRGHFALLLLAALAASMAYGVVLPDLPLKLRQLMPAGTFAEIARHTGWVTGVYTLSLLVFSPLWGWLSDRLDCRWVIAIGLLGGGVMLWLADHADSLPVLYVNRVVSGAFSAAVLPAVLACVAGASSRENRQIYFAWVTAATALGFLSGPIVGSSGQFLFAALSELPRVGRWLSSPFMLVGVISVACAAAVLTIVPALRAAGPRIETGSQSWRLIRFLPTLYMTAAVVFGITTAEVGLTLLGQEKLAIRPQDIAMYFALCSILMVVMQMFAYPRIMRRWEEARVVRQAFLAMAAGLALLGWSTGSGMAVAAFILSAGGVGILLQALTLRMSAAAGPSQGWAMGSQAAAANLGQTVGSALTGVLYAQLALLPFLLAAFLLLSGALVAQRSSMSGTHGLE